MTVWSQCVWVGGAQLSTWKTEVPRVGGVLHPRMSRDGVFGALLGLVAPVLSLGTLAWIWEVPREIEV